MDFLSDALENNIGESLKALRIGRRLTIDQLAQASGVSRAMISRIERGEANPTAVLLARLLGPLNKSLSEFFAKPNEINSGQPLQRATEQSIWRDPQTGYIRRAVSPSGFNTGVDLIEVELPPRARVSFDPLPNVRSQSQYVWLFEGTLEMEANETVHRLEPGDCLYMTLNNRHVFHNPTDETCRYAVVLKKS